MRKPRAADAHHAELDPAQQLELALLKAVKLFNTHVRPRLALVSSVLLAVVLVVVITAAIRSSSRAAMMRGLATLAQAETTDELASVAKEYAGSTAGEQAMFRLARLFYDEGKFAQAATRYSLFCKEYPHSIFMPSARLGEAYALESDGKLVQAEKRFAALAGESLEPTSPGARIYPRLTCDAFRGAGRCAKTQGKLVVSIELYRKALMAVTDDDAEKKRLERVIDDLERSREEPAETTSSGTDKAAVSGEAPPAPAKPAPSAAATDAKAAQGDSPEDAAKKQAN